jgi:1-deoxy-D-xylulose-5-phosphate synthase
VLRLASIHNALVTIVENAVAGGAGSAVIELLATCSNSLPTLTLGIPDLFIELGSRDESLARAELDQASLAAAVERWWSPLAGKQARSGT